MLFKRIVWVKKDIEKSNVFWPSDDFKKRAWINNDSIYSEASKDPIAFWAKLAREGIEWFKE